MAFVGKDEAVVTSDADAFDLAFSDAVSDSTEVGSVVDSAGATGTELGSSGEGSGTESTQQGTNIEATGTDTGAAAQVVTPTPEPGVDTSRSDAAASGTAQPVVVAPDSATEIQRLTALVTELMARTPAQAPAAPAQAPAPAQQTPTAEETAAAQQEEAAWVEFEKDWPEVAAMMAKKYNAVEQQLAAALQTVKQLTEQVDPIVSTLAETEEQEFLQTVLTVHRDANTLLPEVEAWVNTLPRHRQIGANFVLDRGSAHDVIELYTEYKTATGKLAPAQSTTTPDAPSTPALSQPASDRLRKMESVSTRRSVVTEPMDASDFDGAFEAAAE